MNSTNGVHFGRWNIPEHLLEETFDTSGGPGGQHANRSNTAVTLRIDLEEAPLPDEVRARIIERIGDSIVTVTASESRSQWRNRSVARRRMSEILERASKPPRSRKRTKPTRASKRKRLDEKRRRSEVKRQRKSPRDW